MASNMVWPMVNVGLNLRDMLPGDWKDALANEFALLYFQALQTKLATEYDLGKTIFPPKELIFNALRLTPLNTVKVVILGQDPYHGVGQAMGLSFSVPVGIRVPPSLMNMYKVLSGDPRIPGFTIPNHGCLVDWAKNGVLLLNATLTVEAHKPNSHANFGWQTFTDSIIKAVSYKCTHVVFLLMGDFAHKKAGLIDINKHAIITTAHPSPLSWVWSRNYNCFSVCNDLLVKFGMSPINWYLSNMYVV